jgi:AcrR family transcriptional regulator
VRTGSPDKRAAIARAALQVFARQGYSRTSVDTIAEQAGVSKRTIYDYYGDKQRLFLAVVEETMTAQAEAFERLLAGTLGAVDDLRTALVAFGREFATAIARSPERAAVMRLMIAESGHFPALLRTWRPVGAAQQALAERLAQLAEQGLLDIADPVTAAEHLGVLVTGAVNSRSLFGAVPIDDAEIERIVTGGVDVFLRAYQAGR